MAHSIHDCLSNLANFGYSLGTPAATSGDVKGRYVEESSPLDCMDLIKDWWFGGGETNSAHHLHCSRTLSGGRIINPDQPQLPKRCIRVTSPSADIADPSQSHLELRLEETQGSHGKYICLSHRWIQPDTPQSSTTKLNYNARLSGQELNQLPHLFLQTFQTAVKFGIPHVWIDSLCIIQDDPNDWDQESVKMGGYYQLATFTLVSTFAPADMASFTGYSHPAPSNIVRLPYKDKTGAQRGHFYVYPRTSRSLLAKKWASHINDSQLLTRGWIFQEWLLSRRIVCLTPSGVYVQCHCRSGGQTAGQNQYNEEFGWFPPRPDCRGFLSIKASLRLSFHSLPDVYSGWETVIEHYSSLTLTVPEKDRIRAVAGVAAEFAAALDLRALRGTTCTFIAGLWLSDISRGLLWRQASPGRHRRLHGFPTWSWASIETAVRWPLRWWASSEKLRLLNDLSLNRGCQEWNRGRATANIWLNNVVFDDHHRLRPLAHPHSPTTVSRDITVSNNDIPLQSESILDLHGRLQHVFIVGDDLYHSAPQQAPTTNPTAAGTSSLEHCKARRFVIIPADGGGGRPLISGWASLEHPDFQDDNLFFPFPASSPLPSMVIPTSPSTCTKRQITLSALLISTQATAASSFKERKECYRRGPDFAYPTRVEFNVLYLQRCPKKQTQLVINAYERVGVGVLYGDRAKRGFDLAIQGRVQLV